MSKKNGKKQELWGVILAGGTGTRLWPESRRNRPKQFLHFEEGGSFLEQTLQRLTVQIPTERILIVTGRSMRRSIQKLLPSFPLDNILIEPSSRNTAPAIGLAALELLKRAREPVMLVVPSDHWIDSAESFAETIETALFRIEEEPDRLVTIGIDAKTPETGFGYIERGEVLRGRKGLVPCWNVARFHEKPGVNLAKRYCRSGRYFWNAGIFMWRARTILQELEREDPSFAQAFEMIRLFSDPQGRDWSHFCAAYKIMKRISIDYAVMEHARKSIVVKASFLWDDLGSFRTRVLHDRPKKDEQGNVRLGTELLTLSSKENTVCGRRKGKKQRLIALLGVKDLLIVDTEDILLVAQKENESEIPRLLEILRSEGRSKFL